ncbi:hypothetical protein HK102_005094, partial [Quaeritorhiza haematococci]
MKVVLTLAVVLAALSGSVSANPLGKRQSVPAFLDFEPATLVLDGSTTTPQSFRCKLKAPPTSQSPITITFQAPAVTFSNCSVTFTAADWDQFKTIQVVPVPKANDGSGGQGGNAGDQFAITVSAMAPGHPFDDADVAYPVQRQAPREAIRCSAIGDPHFETFDGKRCDYQGDGPYYLVKHDALSIQANHFKCSEGKDFTATCNGAIGLRYGGSAVVLSVQSKGGDGKISLKQASQKLDGMKITTDDEGGSYDVALDDGSRISLSVNSWNDFRYVDTVIMAPGSYHGIAGGLCNGLSKPGQQGGFVHADGSQSDNVNRWGDSWKVPDADNIFMGKINGAGGNVGNLPQAVCTTKPPRPTAAPTTTAETTTSTNAAGVTSPAVETTASPAPGAITSASASPSPAASPSGSVSATTTTSGAAGGGGVNGSTSPGATSPDASTITTTSGAAGGGAG